MRFRVLCLLVALTSAQSTWQNVASMTMPRWTLSVGALNNSLYAVGGQAGAPDATITSSVERYDPAANEWSTVANMSVARVGHGVAAVDGRLFAVGGWNDGCGALGCADVEAYDPQKDSWSQQPPLEFPRDHPAAAALQGKLYVLGGCNGWDDDEKCTNLTASVATFEPASSKWTDVEPMPTPRWGLGAAVWNDKLFAVGGEAADLSRLAVVEEFDPQTGRWRAVASMPEPRAWFGITVGTFPAGEGTMYVVGGCSALSCATPRSSVMAYRPTEDKWATLPAVDSLPAPRFEFGVVILGGNVLYSVGGLHNQNASDVFRSMIALQIV